MNRTISKTGWAVIIAGILICLVVIVAATSHSSGSAGASGIPGQDDNKLSAETSTYLDRCMPLLKSSLADYAAGNYDSAAADYKACGDIPVNTTMDQVVADKYLAYANDVRYYMIPNGGVTLEQVESAQSDAEGSVSAAQSL